MGAKCNAIHIFFIRVPLRGWEDEEQAYQPNETVTLSVAIDPGPRNLRVLSQTIFPFNPQDIAVMVLVLRCP
jgi:hypothetical protein